MTENSSSRGTAITVMLFKKYDSFWYSLKVYREVMARHSKYSNSDQNSGQNPELRSKYIPNTGRDTCRSVKSY